MPIRPVRVAALAAALLVLLASTATAEAATDRVERAVVDAVDRARARHDLPRLHPHRRLSKIAARHSRTMARTGCLCHGRWTERLRGPARGRASETIAVVPGHGRRLARRVVRMWMASPPHRAILLDPKVRRVGVGRHRGPRGWFFTANVARPVAG